MMKVIVLFCAVGLSLCDTPPGLRVPKHYHDEVGIELAARVIASESDPERYSRRMWGGKELKLGEMPYVAGLLLTLDEDIHSICTGSLISNFRVMTSAHCHYDGRRKATTIEVVLGSLTLTYGGTRKIVKGVKVHPKYRYKTYHNDIALLLIDLVEFTDTISYIALPLRGYKRKRYTEEWAIGAGYGLSDSHELKMYRNLQSTEVHVISNKDCRQVYEKQYVIKSSLCASPRKMQGPCIGDSGGPLVFKNDSIQVLIGVMSFSYFTGCKTGFPNAYARVTSHLKWIIQEMGPEPDKPGWLLIGKPK